MALTLTGLTLLSLVSFVGSPQSRDGGTPAETQVSAPVAGGADADVRPGPDTDRPDQTQTAQALTAADKDALRRSAHFANKLYEPRASQVFNLQRSRVESQAAQRSAQGPESPNDEPTLTTDRDDYPPFSYVYFTGTGFQPGETVDMIVVETDPVQQSFEPWTVVADENGNFQTSWYVFSRILMAPRSRPPPPANPPSSPRRARLPTRRFRSTSRRTSPQRTRRLPSRASSRTRRTPSAPSVCRCRISRSRANGWLITSGSVTAASAGTWGPGTVHHRRSRHLDHPLRGDRRQRGSRKRLGALLHHRQRGERHRQSKLDWEHVEQQRRDGH